VKKPVTYVDLAKFEAIVTELNLPAIEQAGFIKVCGPKGRQVYVARTKTVGRVDVSGFTVEHLGVKDLGDDAFGNVRQQLEFAGNEDVILATFRDVLTTMTGLPPLEKQARKAPAPKAKAVKRMAKETVAKAKKAKAPAAKRASRDDKLQAALDAAVKAGMDKDEAIVALA
jgi:hypothetical protein